MMLTAFEPSASSRTGAHGRRLLAGLALALAASFAWALPTPKDIEQAVNAGEYRQAETMLREVIKEKPQSAKAQYELGEVLAREGRNIEARAALQEAQRLDPSLKFASSPQRFNDLLNKIPKTDSLSSTAPGASLGGPAAKPAPTHNTAPVVSQSAPAPASSGSSFPWGYILIAGGVLFVVWKLATRVLPSPSPAPGMAGDAAFGRGPVAQPGYGQAGYGQPGYGQPGYGAPPSSGPGLGGVVLGGLAGAAAGYGLAKVLEHGNEDRGSHDSGGGYGNSGGGSSLGGGSGYSPIDNPPDYGSFDAGSGSSDSWDSGGGSSSDDNNW